MLRGALLLMPLQQPNAVVCQLRCGCDALYCSKDGCRLKDQRLEDTGLHQRGCSHTGTVAHTLLKELVAELVVEASPARNVRAESLTEPAMSALIPEVTGAYMTTLSDRRVSPEVKIKAVDLLEELLHLQANPVANGRERIIRAELTRLQSNADATGPRYDLRAKPQDARDGTELFVDFVITNEASELFVTDQLEYFLAKPLEVNSKSMFGVKAPNTPAFIATEEEKRDKYKHIEHLANVAYQLELTQSKPVFLNPVISARGHLNRDFVTLVDWLAEQKAKHVVATGVLDGVSFSNRKAGFRNDVLDRLVRILLKINALWGDLDAGIRQRGKTARGRTAGPD
jgi:hypothetical protein